MTHMQTASILDPELRDPPLNNPQLLEGAAPAGRFKVPSLVHRLAMWLINVNTLELEEFGPNPPRYGILSHTWNAGQEISFQDWKTPEIAKSKAGYAKIEGACRQASSDGLDYVWVDTNCINKTSSSELSEAINSMFAWYRNAVVCYVYLSDFEISQSDAHDFQQQPRASSFCRSNWFTRGWTLQELLAPTHLLFYSKEWILYGNRDELARAISTATGIEESYVTNPRLFRTAPIAKRMSWMSNRVTTRIEDIAYCMLGIFGINMALLYGEGSKAFLRLQEEIIKVSTDQTILCWERVDHVVPRAWYSVLAPHPAAFRRSAKYYPAAKSSRISPFTITNAGLSISLPILYTSGGAHVVLRARTIDADQRVTLVLIAAGATSSYIRSPYGSSLRCIPSFTSHMESTQLYLRCRVESNSSEDSIEWTVGTAAMQASMALIKVNNITSLHLLFNEPVRNLRPQYRTAILYNEFLGSATVNFASGMSPYSAAILRGESATGGEFLVLVARLRKGNTYRWYVEARFFELERDWGLDMRKAWAPIIHGLEQTHRLRTYHDTGPICSLVTGCSGISSDSSYTAYFIFNDKSLFDKIRDCHDCNESGGPEPRYLSPFFEQQSLTLERKEAERAERLRREH